MTYLKMFEKNAEKFETALFCFLSQIMKLEITCERKNRKCPSSDLTGHLWLAE